MPQYTTFILLATSFAESLAGLLFYTLRNIIFFLLAFLLHLTTDCSYTLTCYATPSTKASLAKYNHVVPREVLPTYLDTVPALMTYDRMSNCYV